MSFADERRFSRPGVRAGKLGLIRRRKLPVVRLQITLPRFSPLYSRAIPSFWLMFFSICLCCGSLTSARAQTDVNDVHVTPRTVESAKAENVSKESLIAPSLNTHVRPLKSSVDLVLVPVTITDPMNRLVTGLDKENFQLFRRRSRVRRSKPFRVKMRRFLWG